MAKRKTYRKKNQKIGGGIASLLIIIVVFAGLVTVNSFYPISDTIPSWSSLKEEFDSYFDKPTQKIGYIDGEVSVQFIDVGQGNCTLIQSNGSNVLIDAGENNQGHLVVNYLKGRGVEKLDYVIATHPHSDHIGGMDIVINDIPTSNIIMPQLKEEMIPTTKTYEDLLLAIQNQGVNVIAAKVGDSYDLSGGVMKILGPTGDFNDLNNLSVGVKYSYGSRNFLITGDMENPAEEALLATGEDVRADVFLLGHHGSKTSNEGAFLDAVNAKYCIAAVGYDNEYGHPHKETVNAVEKRGGTFLRTDLNGTIVFTTDGQSLDMVKSK